MATQAGLGGATPAPRARTHARTHARGRSAPAPLSVGEAPSSGAPSLTATANLNPTLTLTLTLALTLALPLTLTLTTGRTQPRSERAWPATEKGRGVLQSASQPRLVAPMLVSESEMAVARRSATLPSPRSWDMHESSALGLGYKGRR